MNLLEHSGDKELFSGMLVKENKKIQFYVKK
jgi:hypothetical protein